MLAGGVYVTWFNLNQPAVQIFPSGLAQKAGWDFTHTKDVRINQINTLLQFKPHIGLVKACQPYNILGQDGDEGDLSYHLSLLIFFPP